jgi:hypothetical protein
MNAPRLILSHRGKRYAKSFEVAILLVEILVPREANPLASQLSPGENGRMSLQGGRAEECTGTTVPPGDYLGGVPVEFTVDCLTGRCDHWGSAIFGVENEVAYRYR